VSNVTSIKQMKFPKTMEKGEKKAQSPISNIPHKFYLDDFIVPRYCNFCGEFVFGLTKQGFTCSVCNITVHKSCRDSFNTKDCISTPLTKPKNPHKKRQKKRIPFTHSWTEGDLNHAQPSQMVFRNTSRHFSL